MSVQDAFPWEVDCEVGRATYGARKTFVAALAHGDSVILDTYAIAQTCYTVASSLGLAASIRRVNAGRPETWFTVCGPRHV